MSGQGTRKRRHTDKNFMFKKILVVNRGEIAVRIIRAAKESGFGTVAVYSEADRQSLHARMADESIYLGKSEPLKSYLNMDAIFDAVEKSGADAIHPGYGFLAENHHFAKLCEDKGIVFIGPKSNVIQLMGDKIASRKAMQDAKIPVIPGIEIENGTPEQMQKAAESIGYPVLIKAAGGGGGKGMRIVKKSLDFMDSLAA